MHPPSSSCRSVILSAVLIFLISSAGALTSAQEGESPEEDQNGWRLPANAEGEKNPLQSTPQVLAVGRALFEKNCRRCHGPKGTGDGPDAEMEHMADMDLTNPDRAAKNPDGIVFYKAWNGREDPKMPAFRNELSREQLWAIVTYVQTLRRTPGQ